MKRKTASDYILFYVCEVLIVCAGEWYIIQDYYNRHGAVSLPFCVGMLLTGVVAGVAMHWALTKYCPKLIYGGYFVWLGETGLILFSAGVIWTANSRIEAHDKAVADLSTKVAQAEKLKSEAKTVDVQNDLSASLAKMQALQPLLQQARTNKQRNEILAMAGIKPTPTPAMAIKDQVALAIAPVNTKPVAPEAPVEFRPFAEGSWFEFWYSDVIRFTGIFGLIGMAVLFGLFLKYSDTDTALMHMQVGSVTTATVQTNAGGHNQTVQPQPVQTTTRATTMAMSPPAPVQSPGNQTQAHSTTTFSTGGQPGNSQGR